MKKVYLGQFKTDGNVVVSDPCYKEIKSGSNQKIKIKPGSYKVSVIYGKYKKRGMPWDRVPGTFRVAQLIIEHSENKKKLKYSKTKNSISVDSGQAGFFNLKTYQKDQPELVDLVNEEFSFLLEEITSNYIQISRSKIALKDKNDLYLRMKKLKKTKSKTDEYFKQNIEEAQENIKDYKKILKTGKYPDYWCPHEKRSSKEFYEIICDKTMGKHRSDVCVYGAVSSSGFGDGGYDLYLAKNSMGKIVGCYLEYLPLNEIK
jgi:hypothetical protein